MTAIRRLVTFVVLFAVFALPFGLMPIANAAHVAPCPHDHTASLHGSTAQPKHHRDDAPTKTRVMMLECCVTALAGTIPPSLSVEEAKAVIGKRIAYIATDAVHDGIAVAPARTPPRPRV